MSIRISIVAIVCCVALFASCSKEMAMDEQPLPEGAVRIVLSVGDTKSDSQTDPQSDPQTRAAAEDGSAAENRIANIKVLFYDHGTQTLDLIKRIDDVTAPSDDPTISWASNRLIITEGINQSKAYDIYVIANWTEGFNASDFAKGSPVANLTAAFTRISGQIVAPDASHALLMSGSAISHIFSTNATAQVPLMRQVAKIRINVQIGADFKAQYPNAVFGAKASPNHNKLTVYNIPNSSYVYGTTNENRYNALMAKEGSKLLNYPTITMTPAATETAVYETETLYVYENITLGTTAGAKEKATFMVLRLPYKLTPTANAVTDNYYKFYIQDNADRTDPHKTVRNHIYDLTATVVGFGGSMPSDGKDAYVTTTVLDWNAVELREEELGTYLRLSRMTTADKSFTLKDGDYVIGKGETIKVHCLTNIGGWRALTYKDGALVNSSKPSNVIRWSEVQAIDIAIPATTSDTGVEYTIKLYHPTIAPESVGPFETLTLKQAVGVIPNSVLAKSFETADSWYKGWPVYLLPPHGLQIAKRGNKLPSEAALSGDPEVVWSTISSDITGIDESLGYGFGKANTKKILEWDAARYKYLAANECKELSTRSGEEWYLPTLDELLSIYATQGVLGNLSSSYSFSSFSYWSSTMYYYDRFVYAVSFSNGRVSRVKPISTFLPPGARCVRDI